MRPFILLRRALAGALLLAFAGSSACALLANIDAPGPESCANGARDPGEEDTDCGGVCRGACPRQVCAQDIDCASSHCGDDKTCLPPSCNDGRWNGGEQALDCGGPSCPACNGGACAENGGCKSGLCAHAVCRLPTCYNFTLDEGETGTDCGGQCAACNNAPCKEPRDCASNICAGGVCACSTCGVAFDDFKLGRAVSAASLCRPPLFVDLYNCACAGNCKDACKSCEQPEYVADFACSACVGTINEFGGCGKEYSLCYNDK